MGREVNRLGEENYNSYGTLMRIVEYKSAINIIVEFQDEYKARVHATYGDFKRGKVKNPYDKTAFGVGYIGVGKYKATEKDGKKTKAYQIWKSMLERCYDPYRINKYPTYKDCCVCDEWLCYQNFAKWYEENVYNCNNERLHLDKDILYKGNKIYSPDTCVFVPQCVNNLFVKRDRNRGDLPVGVSFHKPCNKYRARCHDGSGHEIYLGLYNTPEEAFEAYKQYKEQTIKDIAEEYRNVIPEVLYNAMINYEVEIED